MNSNKQKIHTFAICAYNESPFLEECIESLERQSKASEIIIVTHTPSVWLSMIAEKHGLKVFVNTGDKGITQDWNFALDCVDTEFATIAHQDDVYEPDYTASLLPLMEKSERPLIAFSDYFELRGTLKTKDTKILKIKRLMLLPLRSEFSRRSKFIRRRVLSLGDAICCPSVMYALKNIQRPLFQNHFQCCEDWEAWEKLSKCSGDFIYVSRPLMSHRIHEDSTTSKVLGQGGRISENYEMYRKFWPPLIAKIINHFYTDSEKSNTLT